MNFWDYQIGHILHVGPDEVGEVSPGDLLAASLLFEGLYQRG